MWLGLALVATLLSIWLKVATALSEIVVGTITQLIIGTIAGGLLLAVDDSPSTGNPARAGWPAWRCRRRIVMLATKDAGEIRRRLSDDARSSLAAARIALHDPADVDGTHLRHDLRALRPVARHHRPEQYSILVAATVLARKGRDS